MMAIAKSAKDNSSVLHFSKSQNQYNKNAVRATDNEHASQ